MWAPVIRRSFSPCHTRADVVDAAGALCADSFSPRWRMQLTPDFAALLATLLMAMNARLVLRARANPISAQRKCGKMRY